ncbi:MAG: DMT family transporter [Lachnospiraceae bacterium]|nr:DMT family transporter [Lachnospiraceae bacterium]
MTTGKKSAVCVLALLGAALFWGTTFVAQNLGAGHVGTFTFLALRCYIGTAFLFPFILIRDLHRRKKLRTAFLTPVGEERKAGKGKIVDSAELVQRQKARDKEGRKVLLIAGFCCGGALFLGSALQQYGIGLYVAEGDPCGTAKSSLITALYVILVPIISTFVGKKPDRKLWISVGLCLVGMYLLCIKDSFTLTRGDLFILLCAVGFAIQIMAVGYFSPKTDGLKLSAMQFLGTALISTVCMLLFEEIEINAILAALPSILYAGIVSNGIAYTLQIVGQKGVKPTVASLIMCMESLFGTLSGWLILHEVLTLREMAGCGLMFVAILLATAFESRAQRVSERAPRRRLFSQRQKQPA